jgi:hypothetical protein
VDAMMKSVKTAIIAGAALIAFGSLCVTQGRAAGGPDPVRLGSGSIRQYHWWVNVYRGHTRKVPCIDINLVDRAGETPVEGEVGETSCRSTVPLPNALAVVDELDHPKFTVLAMGFPKDARTVTLEFNGRLRQRTVPLELLSPVKARKAGLQPFRYFTLAFLGDSCLSRFITHDARGRTLFDGGRMHCHA